VLFGWAEDVELFGVLPHLLVVIRGTDVHRYHRAGQHFDALDHCGLHGGAHDPEERRFPPESFFDRLRHE